MDDTRREVGGNITEGGDGPAVTSGIIAASVYEGIDAVTIKVEEAPVSSYGASQQKSKNSEGGAVILHPDQGIVTISWGTTVVGSWACARTDRRHPGWRDGDEDITACRSLAGGGAGSRACGTAVKAASPAARESANTVRCIIHALHGFSRTPASPYR